MIIKESELKALRDQITKLTGQLETERKESAKKIRELEKDLNPNEVYIKYYEVSNFRPVKPGSSHLIVDNFEIDTTVDLSRGIRTQIFRMLRSITKSLNDKYWKEYCFSRDALEKQYKDDTELFKNQLKLRLIKTGKAHNIFTVREALLNEILK